MILPQTYQPVKKRLPDLKKPEMVQPFLRYGMQPSSMFRHAVPKQNERYRQQMPYERNSIFAEAIKEMYNLYLKQLRLYCQIQIAAINTQYQQAVDELDPFKERQFRDLEYQVNQTGKDLKAHKRYDSSYRDMDISSSLYKDQYPLLSYGLSGMN